MTEETNGSAIYLTVQLASLGAILAAGIVFVVTIKGDVRESAAKTEGQNLLIDERSKRNAEDIERLQKEIDRLEDQLNQHRISHRGSE